MLKNNIEIVKVKGINKCTFKNKNVWDKLQQQQKKREKKEKYYKKCAFVVFFLSIQDITVSKLLLH